MPKASATPLSNCQVVISRGKNMGRRCGEVNRKCRHKISYCPYCGAEFTMETSYYRHIKVCDNAVKDNGSRKKVTIKPKPKRKAPANKQQVEPPPEMHTLLDRIKLLEQELEQVKTRPTTVTHNWNIVLGSNFYEELVQQMGQQSAIDYLMEIASESKPIDVISKLYLEGNDPSDYPVACRGQDHFRYITSEHKIVDDKGGHNISKIVSNGVMDALVLAAQDAITEQMADEGEDNEGNVPQDKLLAMQDHMLQMQRMVSKRDIVSKLAELTNNPNHPFFNEK